MTRFTKRPFIVHRTAAASSSSSTAATASARVHPPHHSKRKWRGHHKRVHDHLLPRFLRPQWANRYANSKLSPDDAYLSYYDVRLTREDVDSIRSDWLTDNAIAFWEEYLEREKLNEFPKANIVLLRPSMSFMLQKTPDPLTLKEALPDFAKTSHVFLPINDCRSVTVAEGGSHWSLLLVSVVDGVAFHYDSLMPSNYDDAKLVAYKISQLLGKPLRFINLDDTPQQDNSMDCGVYVCLLMQHLLLSKLLRAHAQQKVSMSMRNKEVNASGGRKEMLKLIETRRKEGERRRSRSHSPYTRGGTKSKSPPRIGEENDDMR